MAASGGEPIERHALGANSWKPFRWRSALTCRSCFARRDGLPSLSLRAPGQPEIPGAEQDPQQFEQDLVHLLLEDIINKRLDDAGPLAEGRRLGLRLITPDGQAGFLEGHQVRDLILLPGGELSFFCIGSW
jgi:hypothetical protein